MSVLIENHAFQSARRTGDMGSEAIAAKHRFARRAGGHGWRPWMDTQGLRAAWTAQRNVHVRQ
jgi:hypothetical protein